MKGDGLNRLFGRADRDKGAVIVTRHGVELPCSPATGWDALSVVQLLGEIDALPETPGGPAWSRTPW